MATNNLAYDFDLFDNTINRKSAAAPKVDAPVKPHVVPKKPRSRKDKSSNQLILKGAPYAVIVLFSVKLSRKITRTAHCAENAEIKNKQQLINNGHTCHFESSDPTDHYIIKHTYKICNTALNHYRYRNCKHPFVIRQAFFDIVLHHIILLIT